MTNRLYQWMQERHNGKKEISLDDVQPMHPNDYPAKKLKDILDSRRARSIMAASYPSGMLDGQFT